jgi:hypothetical protein
MQLPFDRKIHKLEPREKVCSYKGRLIRREMESYPIRSRILSPPTTCSYLVHPWGHGGGESSHTYLSSNSTTTMMPYLFLNACGWFLIVWSFRALHWHLWCPVQCSKSRKASLDCSEDMHRSIENLYPKKGWFDAKVGMANKMENLIRIPRVGVLTRSSFLFKGSRLPQKFDLQRTPLAHKNKNVCHVGKPCHFFHSCLKFSTENILVVV